MQRAAEMNSVRRYVTRSSPIWSCVEEVLVVMVVGVDRGTNAWVASIVARKMRRGVAFLRIMSGEGVG